MFDLVDNGSWSGDVMGLICHTPHLCGIFLTNILILCPCVPARVQLTQLKLNSLELDSEVGRLVSVINVTLFD